MNAFGADDLRFNVGHVNMPASGIASASEPPRTQYVAAIQALPVFGVAGHPNAGIPA